MATKKNPRLDQERIDFEALIEKPDFRAQTANGTAKAMGKGWNRDYQFGPMPEAESGGPWQPGRSNRTGE